MVRCHRETGTALNALGTYGTRGRGGSVLSSCQKQQRTGLAQGPLSSIRAVSAANRGVCAHLQGKRFLCGTPPGWGWGFCSQLWPQGGSVVCPEIHPKPQVCLSLFHLEQFELFFSPTQNYPRIPCREISESKDSETFPSALLWLIYNTESVYCAQFDTLLYCKIIATIALFDNWIMSHNYLFCMCGENLDLLS